MSIRQKMESLIIEAALKCFANQDERAIFKIRASYEQATIEDIAADVGLPKANIHYYFKTKDQLYNECINIAKLRPNDETAIIVMAKHHLNKGDIAFAKGALDSFGKAPDI